MNRCSGCGYLVPAAWAVCQRCGAALGADAPVPEPVGATATHPGAANTAPPVPPTAPPPAAADRPAPPPLPAPPRRPAPPVSGTAPPAPHTTALGSPPAHDPRAADPQAVAGSLDASFDLLPAGRPGRAPRIARVRPARAFPARGALALAAVACVVALGWLGVRALSSGNGDGGAGPGGAEGTVGTDDPIAGALTVQATANARSAGIALQSFYAETGDLMQLDLATLQAMDPSLTFVDGGTSAGDREVSVAISAPMVATLAAGSSGGSCAFWRMSDMTIETATAAGDCRAGAAPATGWQPTR